MNDIHPTAIVEKGAELDGVTVGPYCIVKAGVHIGSGTVLQGHCWIEGDTVLGKGNVVFPFASIGKEPQDLKYRGEPTRTRIGNHNQFREGSTVHRGTTQGRSETTIGSHCLVMSTAHIAHDCVIGDHVIMANGSGLAGHVEIENGVIMGGMCGVHQFTRVGTGAFLSSGTLVAQDVPPFCIADGRRAGLAGVNVIGMQRAGISADAIKNMRRAFREFYLPGRLRPEAIAAVEAIPGAEVKRFIEFIKASTRGVLRARRDIEGDDE